MKTIMIFGTCRSGKTTFCKMIQEKYKNFQIIEVDAIIAALQKVIKDIPIGYMHDEYTINKLPEFLNYLIHKNKQLYGDRYGFIINSDSIMPKDIVNFINYDDAIIYFFVQQELSTKEIFNNCRKYDDNSSWTIKRSDENLLSHLEKSKQFEKEIIKQCKEYKFKLIDTSKNRDETLNDLLQDISKKL